MALLERPALFLPNLQCSLALLPQGGCKDCLPEKVSRCQDLPLLLVRVLVTKWDIANRHHTAFSNGIAFTKRGKQGRMAPRGINRLVF